MRRFITAGLVALLIAGPAGLFPLTVAAAPAITLLDGEHHIRGSASVSGTDENGQPFSLSDQYEDFSAFNAADGLPTLQDSARIDPFISAESLAEVFVLEARSVALPEPGDLASSMALAEGSWLFTPDWSTLRLNFFVDVHGEDPSLINLRDETTQTQLYLWSEEGPPERRMGEWNLEFSVDPTHLYRLQASLLTTAVIDGPWLFRMEALVIPAPAAVVLAGLGAGGLCWLRRRRLLGRHR